MTFQPVPNQEISIDNLVYRVAEHPSAPGIPYGQEGREAIVYQLLAENGETRALKVFRPRFRTPSLVLQADRIAPLDSLPGLQVCQRVVLTPSRHEALLKSHPDLIYAVLMPWVEGFTWQELLLENRELVPEQSLTIARAISKMLLAMEERGIAHCDLSASNLILSTDLSSPSVGLVDVEGMHTPDLSRPKTLPAGSPGYAHQTAPQGLWSTEADRFAGAVLMAEILGWSIAEVREAAWGENYFPPQEMQQDNDRYQTLVTSLRAHWGDDVASLFTRAWHSDTLTDCPTLGEWLVALPDEVLTPVVIPEEAGEPETVQEATQLMTQAEEAASQNDLDERHESVAGWQCPNCGQSVQQALDLCPHCEQGRRETPIEEQPKLEEERVPEPAKSKAADWRCLHCGEDAPGDSDMCPSCEKGRWEPAVEKQPKEKRSIQTWAWIGGGLVIIMIMIALFRGGTGTSMTATRSTVTFAPSKTSPVTLYPPSNTFTPIPTFTLIPIIIQQGTVDQVVILRTLSGHNDWLWSVAFTPDGTLLASGSNDETVKLWDVESGQEVNTLHLTGFAALSVAFSPDGTLLASGSSDNTVNLWEVESGQELRTFRGHSDYVWSVAFSPDGTLLASGSLDGTVKLWDVESGQVLRTLSGHSDGIWSVDFSPDGTLLASGSLDGTVKLWDVESGQVLRTLSGYSDGVWSVDFSPNGTMLASSEIPATVKLWEVESGQELRTLTGHSGSVNSVTFSPDGTLLASGSWDGTVKLWKVNSGQELRTLSGYSSSIMSVAFSPEGTLLASGSADGPITLWGIPSP